MASRFNTKFLAFLLGGMLILALAAVLRLGALDADPPRGFTSNFVSDEAWWAHNARNRTLFGKWVLDDFNQGLFAAPLHTAIMRLSFIVGGVSLRQTRVVSAISGLGSVALIGLLLGRTIGGWSALAGMFILTTDYFMLVYDRTGFVEPLPAFLMLLSATLAILGRDRKTMLFLSGVVAVLAMFAKANAVFFVPVPFVFLLMHRLLHSPTEERPWRRVPLAELFSYATGVLLCFAVWFFLFILPNYDQYMLQNGRLRDESKIRGLHLVFNVLTTGMQKVQGKIQACALLTWSVLPAGLGCLWVIHWGGRVWRRGLKRELHRLTDLELFSLLWFLLFLPYFMLYSNEENRRYYVFLFPVTLLGTHVLLSRRSEFLRFARTRRPQYALASAVVGMVLCSLPVLLYMRPPIADILSDRTKTITFGNDPGLSFVPLSTLSTMISLAALVICAPIVLFVLRRVHVRVGLLAIALCVFLVPWQLFSVGSQIRGLEYTLLQATEKAQSRNRRRRSCR